MKKIDLFYNGQYLCSTNMSKTCREAKARLLEVYSHNVNSAAYSERYRARMTETLNNTSLLKAYFSKG